MNRRYCLMLGVVVLASCSSTDAPPTAAAGASAVAGAGAGGSPAGGSPAGGSSGASTAGGAGLGTSAGSGNASGAGGADAGGTSGGASGAAGASSGAGGASGASSGAGGKGGSGGNAGSAGAPAKFCDGKPLLTAPVVVTEVFELDQVGKDLNLQLHEYDSPDSCDGNDTSAGDAVGSCWEWDYTPETGGGTVKLQWLSDPTGAPGDTYVPVCMAAGMTKVAFLAKGTNGGEVVTFGASQATPVDITLTDQWKQYSVSLTNVKYNSDSQGVQPGFFWSLDATKNPGKTSVRFGIDDIKYVNN
jgi:hypothetical protein